MLHKVIAQTKDGKRWESDSYRAGAQLSSMEMIRLLACSPNSDFVDGYPKEIEDFLIEDKNGKFSLNQY